MPHFLYAPVSKNEIIGNVEYTCLDRSIYKSNIIANSDIKDVNADIFNTVFEIFKHMMSII